jgi:hypothetical protein
VPTNDDEREFRLRPRKPPRSRTHNNQSKSSGLFRAVMRHARMTRKQKSRAGGRTRSLRTNQPWYQRCAVRVMYSRNAVRGQWGAHGRYLARETREADPKTAGFGQESGSVAISQQLDRWQKAGDERMWKLIVSPEFGDRVDLKCLTRELMARMGIDLGTDALEWTAVAHYNTEYPHVHIALRGVDGHGHRVHLDEDYVKSGIRRIAENLCTQQLGNRKEQDVEAAERREVSQSRFTSLDRIIKAGGGERCSDDDYSRFFTFHNSARTADQGSLGTRAQHISERLIVLQNMGLAKYSAPNEWLIRHDFETVLRAMQRIGDRQKTLAAHGIPMSDERLSVSTLEYRNLMTVEGRVLVHGEEENGRYAGRGYLMLEGTDARVHHIYYTPEMEDARNKGGLRTGSFVRLRKVVTSTRSRLEIDDLGDSEAVLRNGAQLRQTARNLIKRGIIPDEDGWGGWLGRYQSALKQTTMEELIPERRSSVEKDSGLG